MTQPFLFEPACANVPTLPRLPKAKSGIFPATPERAGGSNLNVLLVNSYLDLYKTLQGSSLNFIEYYATQEPPTLCA